MTKRLQQLMAKRATTRAQMDTLLTAADASDGVLAADAAPEYATLEASLAAIDESMGREKRLIEADRNAPVDTSRTPNATASRDRGADVPFASLGEQLMAIASVGMGTADATTNERLHAAASGAGAATGPDGGFLIQKDFATDLSSSGYETGILSSRCSTTEISANADGLEVVYVDETSRANGSRWGGVQIYRRKEADTVNATKPKLGKWEVRLEDLMGLAYVTDRAMQDAGALGQVFSEAFTEEFGYVIDDEIYNGDGAGQCQGILTAPATVTQAKEAGQAANTIVFANVANMWSRVPMRSRTSGIWAYNVEAEPQLQQMTIGGTAAIPVFMPPGGLSGGQYHTIYGRPAIPIEQAAGLSSVGDIAFLDLSQYKLIRKGGVQSDESIHVRFVYGERTFRWITRVNGAPKWRTPRTPAKGTKTISPFVVLQAR